MKFAQSYPTFFFLDCSLPGSSVHGILQGRTLEWVAIPFSGDLPNPGIKLRSPALQADSVPSEQLGKPTVSSFFGILSEVSKSVLLRLSYTNKQKRCLYWEYNLRSKRLLQKILLTLPNVLSIILSQSRISLIVYYSSLRFMPLGWDCLQINLYYHKHYVHMISIPP